AHGHALLAAEVPIGPLPSWAQGRGLLSALRLCRFGLWTFLCQGQQGAPALLQAFAGSFRHGLCPLVLLDLEGRGLLVHPLVGCLQGLSEWRLLALMMPGGTENLLPTIVDIECTMVDHVLEAMLLYLMTLPVDPWPLLRLEGVLDLRRAPIHQSLARNGLDDHKVAGLIFSGPFFVPPVKTVASPQGVSPRGFQDFLTPPRSFLPHLPPSQAPPRQPRVPTQRP